MRLPVAVALGIVTLLGCNRPREGGGETGQAGTATDTTITTKQTQDTMLVSHDTSVDVDTTVKHGDKSTRVDTTKKSGAGKMGTSRDTAR
jgi:hypothetical protein